MKKLFTFSLSIVLLVFVSGCDNGAALGRPSGTILVTIEREVILRKNPILVFAAKGAQLDYKERLLKITDYYAAGGKHLVFESDGWLANSWPVHEIIFISSREIIVKIPSDAGYLVQIGDQRHVLTEVVEQKK